MERNNNGKIMAVIALVVAVISLSLGFAAYSTSLQISTVADVTANNNWNVGFSKNGTTMAPLNVSADSTVAGTNSNGVLDITKYTVQQNTHATLTTTAGSEVKYSFYVLNTGSITAYGDSLTFANVPVTCAPASGNSSEVIEGTASAGTTRTGGNSTPISDEDCAAMFGLSLKIDETTYVAGESTTGFGSTSISAETNKPVELRLWYKGDTAANTAAAKLDGDIVVTAGTITAVYKSNNS